MSPDSSRFDALRANRLLSLLPEAVLAAVSAHAQPVTLELRDPVSSEGKPIRPALVPAEGVVSMLASIDRAHTSIEIAVGNEGMAGLPLFLGAPRAPGALGAAARRTLAVDDARPRAGRQLHAHAGVPRADARHAPRPDPLLAESHEAHMRMVAALRSAVRRHCLESNG